MKLNEQHWRRHGDNLTISFSNRLKVTGVAFPTQYSFVLLCVDPLFGDYRVISNVKNTHATCCHLLRGEAIKVINLWRNSKTFLNLLSRELQLRCKELFFFLFKAVVVKSFHESIQVQKFLWESTPQVNQHRTSSKVLFPLELIFDSCNNIMMKNIRNMRGRVSVKEKLNLLFMVAIICCLAGVWRRL